MPDGGSFCGCSTPARLGWLGWLLHHAWPRPNKNRTFWREDDRGWRRSWRTSRGQRRGGDQTGWSIDQAQYTVGIHQRSLSNGWSADHAQVS
ncbi:hypothetical protein PVAP13_2NG232900 [Panicum virgatum]|uniref:Uncharacterized protein n=1 Tax=Panicum virgatum TaxID=38727 RepID=A0A8T0VMR7_PANVG|nr:hypothetical protein PVAP13_2NG232900 [Panicum virgatum]